MSSNYYRIEFEADTNCGYNENYTIYALLNNSTDFQHWYYENGNPIELVHISDDFVSKLMKALTLIEDDDIKITQISWLDLPNSIRDK